MHCRRKVLKKEEFYKTFKFKVAEELLGGTHPDLKSVVLKTQLDLDMYYISVQEDYGQYKITGKKLFADGIKETTMYVSKEFVKDFCK